MMFAKTELGLSIYLLNLFNVYYKTLAAYALIKIDYSLLSSPIKNIIKM